ncbi:MAG: type II 3-dehydroquinate dehydratase [Desulfovibrionaceae bacterium]
MAKTKILILNGPNLGHLGERQPEIYGGVGMDAVPGQVRELLGAKADDVELEFFQANGEGAIIDRLERAREEGVAGVALNAGAYTHTSLAIADCLAWIGVPTVEVHLSNVLARTEDPVRQRSYMGKAVIGVVAGFGIKSYALAVLALCCHIKK